MESLQNAFKQGKFVRTENRLQQIAGNVQARFQGEIEDSWPSWWGRMALSTGQGGGGGILIRRVAGGYRVYYPNLGRYNYLSVIEQGRGAYSIKDALMRSPRTRKGQTGRYIVIPMPAKADNESPVLKRKGLSLDAEGKTRISYKGMQPGSSGTVRMAQNVKGGKVQTASMKFVVVSERSKGWIYPAIKANPISQKLQSEVDTMLPNDSRLKKAIEQDVSEFLRRKLGGK